MYTLKEWLKLTIGSEPYEGWDGRMFSSENDLAMTQKTNITQALRPAIALRWSLAAGFACATTTGS